MYVDFDTYSGTVFGGKVTEGEYPAYSSLADELIDAWTNGAVGRSDELPESVVNLYSAIVSNVGSLVDSTGTEAALTSFSNGVDSYGFDTSTDSTERLRMSLSWLIEAIPLEYVTEVANRPPSRCWHG